MVSSICFALSLICYGIRELTAHGQLRWSSGYFGFWGEQQDYRKYKDNNAKDPLSYEREPAPDNFYYKYIARVKYKERWFTSTNLTVMFTDSYHALQHLYFVFLSLGISLSVDVPFYYVWPSVLFLHWLTRRILSK